MKRPGRMYNKVDRCLIRDPRFRSLSKEARDLWLYFLIAPDSKPCPGLIPVSIHTIIGDLQLSPFDEYLVKIQDAIKELEERNWIKFDQNANLFLLRNALKHNPPESLNVIKNWEKHFREMPKCDLRDEWIVISYNFIKDIHPEKSWINTYLQVFEKYIEKLPEKFTSRLNGYLPEGLSEGIPEGLSEGIPEGLSEGIPEGLSEGIPEGLSEGIPEDLPEECVQSCDIQEQEQEQKQKISIYTVPHASEHNENDIKKENTNDVQNSDSQKFELKNEIRKVLITDPPPKDFTERQKAFLKALKEAKFFLKKGAKKKHMEKHGDILGFDAVRDPIDFSRTIGDKDVYPLINHSEIKKAAAWTQANHARAKVFPIDKFLLGWLSRAEENSSKYNNKKPQNFNQSYQNYHPSYKKIDSSNDIGKFRNYTADDLDPEIRRQLDQLLPEEK